MVKKAGTILYSIYSFLVFCLVFIFLFPLFLIIIQRKKWHKYAMRLNSIWATVVFFLWGKKMEIVYEESLKKGESYVFCPNHFSFLDIATMAKTPTYFCFVGKSSIAKVPVFGYMFRKLHITVDRNDMRSRYETILKARQAIEEGFSLVMFPEGGMVTSNPPQMGRFKDGAFRVAIEKQIPVIPVTIPYNWILLPDKKIPLMRRGKTKVIYHQPITTTGMTMEDLPKLKNRTYSV
ncbi:1-acyl-sn-glycerol-3-phosphate acyltransferase, partial [Cytophagales bacterium RKSG123]|nr:1-acyl-sn-glycerol-3-phosphate acyltransferase [Xanthovirga aplysinae]